MRAGKTIPPNEDLCCKCHHWFGGVIIAHLHITSPSPDPGPRFQMMGKNVSALYPTDIRSSEPRYFRRVWPASLLEQSGKAAHVCHIFAGTTPCVGTGFGREGVLQSAVCIVLCEKFHTRQPPIATDTQELLHSLLQTPLPHIYSNGHAHRSFFPLLCRCEASENVANGHRYVTFQMAIHGLHHVVSCLGISTDTIV